MLAWGLETIKHIQKHVGLAAANDGANEDRVKAPHPNKGGCRVSFQVDEVQADDGSTQIAAIKAKQASLASIRPAFALKAEREETRKTHRVTIAKLGDELAMARAYGHATVVKALKARLHDLRHCAQDQEQRWNYLEDKIAEPKGYIHINTASFRFRTPSPEMQRSDKGSSRGRLLSTEDEIIFKGRSLSAESWVPNARSLSSESSSPARAASKPPLATRQEGSFRGRMKTSSTGGGLGPIARSLSSKSSSPTRAASNLADSRCSIPKKLVAVK
ncbi:hypothetical protein T484DRAFT_1938931 [Baffinella frigidus]|nr:hypothetical protein T484DRAFT_1938931 [Cryptophyta sp. CCMP2293]